MREAPPLTVEQSIAALALALLESKGWMLDYSDSIIRDAIDRVPAPPTRERIRAAIIEYRLRKGSAMDTDDFVNAVMSVVERPTNAVLVPADKLRELQVQAAGKVPLTYEQIVYATEHIDTNRSGYFVEITRAIERAHGIGIPEQGQEPTP